jgi:hypothetical protein
MPDFPSVARPRYDLLLAKRYARAAGGLMPILPDTDGFCPRTTLFHPAAGVHSIPAPAVVLDLSRVWESEGGMSTKIRIAPEVLVQIPDEEKFLRWISSCEGRSNDCHRGEGMTRMFGISA